MPFLAINLKQAWLIPSAVAPCRTRTERRPAGGSTVPTAGSSSPCPGRRARCVRCGATRCCPACASAAWARDRAVRTLRLTGIGESLVADRLGEALLRAANPEVATYARADAVDVRIVGDRRAGRRRRPRQHGRRAARRGRAGRPGRARRARLGARRDDLARGGPGRARSPRLDAGDARARARRRPVTLLGSLPMLRRAELLPARAAARRRSIPSGDAARPAPRRAGARTSRWPWRRARRGADTAVSVGVATPARTARRRSMAFLGGDLGRSRAAIAGAALLLETLRGERRPMPARRRARAAVSGGPSARARRDRRSRSRRDPSG